MNDDLISKPPIQDISSTDPDPESPEAESQSVRVFDITPDLNIAPAKDEVETPPETPIPENVVRTLNSTTINLIKPTAPTTPAQSPIGLVNLVKPATPPTSGLVNLIKPEPRPNVPQTPEKTGTIPPIAPLQNTSPVVPSVAPTSGIAPTSTPAPATATAPDNLPTVTIPISPQTTTFTPPFVTPVPTSPTPTKTESSTPSFGPANPPAKTIVSSMSTFTKAPDSVKNPSAAPISLQEAISPLTEQQVKVQEKASIQNDPNVKPLRTYESDIAEAMAKKHLSSSSIIIAENKRKQAIKDQTIITPVEEKVAVTPPTPIDMIKPANPVELVRPTVPVEPIKPTAPIEPTAPIRSTDYIGNNPPQSTPVNASSGHSGRNWALGIISLILVCGGVFAGYYIYEQSPMLKNVKIPAPTNGTPITNVAVQTPANAPEQQFPDSIIKSDSRTSITVGGQSQVIILKSIRKEVENSQAPNTIKEIILSKLVNNKLQKIAASEAMALGGVSAPEIFNRSLATDWMLGVYAREDGRKDVFVVAKNEFFQNAFAGMIQWEKTMPDDLKQYLYQAVVEQNEATSTASSNFTLRGKYNDRIVKNKDVREYISDNGQIIFLYSFVSNDKLILAGSEEALQEIINRLEKSTFVR